MRFSLVLVSLAVIGLVQPALSQTPPAPPAPPAAAAAHDEGPQAPLFCTLTTAHSCTAQGCTKAESFGDLKLPAKLLLHFDSKVIASTSADGFPHISQIGSLARTGTDYVLQGIDHALAWVVHLDQAGSKMTFVTTSNSTVLTGTGSCKKPG
jgi:hypothetical protein